MWLPFRQRKRSNNRICQQARWRLVLIRGSNRENGREENLRGQIFKFEKKSFDANFSVENTAVTKSQVDLKIGCMF
jgi:hypothetical protein